MISPGNHIMTEWIAITALLLSEHSMNKSLSDGATVLIRFLVSLLGSPRKSQTRWSKEGILSGSGDYRSNVWAPHSRETWRWLSHKNYFWSTIPSGQHGRQNHPKEPLWIWESKYRKPLSQLDCFSSQQACVYLLLHSSLPSGPKSNSVVQAVLSHS